MLIFINFHPQDEGKKWIHQDYMDNLKNKECSTARLNKMAWQATNKPTFNPHTEGFFRLASQKAKSFQKDFMRQASLSARGFGRRVTLGGPKITERLNLMETEDLHKVDK